MASLAPEIHHKVDGRIEDGTPAKARPRPNYEHFERQMRHVVDSQCYLPPIEAVSAFTSKRKSVQPSNKPRRDFFKLVTQEYVDTEQNDQVIKKRYGDLHKQRILERLQY